MDPAGWIPPAYRETLYADSLSEQDLEAIRLTMRIWEGDHCRVPTDDEIRKQVRRVVGVKDKRTGEVRLSLTDTPIVSINT